MFALENRGTKKPRNRCGFWVFRCNIFFGCTTWQSTTALIELPSRGCMTLFRGCICPRGCRSFLCQLLCSVLDFSGAQGNELLRGWCSTIEGRVFPSGLDGRIRVLHCSFYGLGDLFSDVAFRYSIPNGEDGDGFTSAVSSFWVKLFFMRVLLSRLFETVIL